MKPAARLPQSLRAWHPASPLAEYMWVRDGRVRAKVMAMAASAAIATHAWVRNWRQVSLIMTPLLAAACAQGCRWQGSCRPGLGPPGWVVDRLAGADQQETLLVGVAFLDNFLTCGEGGRVAARPGQPAVRGQQRADLRGDPDP